ncbi:DEAD/DEAH box helicase [Tissierella creatinophila]|uniref:RNA polymerase-associated protein RapA n=1 Tax=Tissierella creatinophila DSM 6911 TaxID=1123403 RepID=A0A1U7M3V8_TISCR|nr:DEAD/DEAH box helicase [Tissierella creatinophila]OLS01899.1 RNA polymerase-associated protein RapA [Tissierella creatinophila DSM 6911]
MHNITKTQMINRVNISTTYFKGNDYYKQGNVKNIRTNPNHDYFVANIYGSEVYHTEAKFDVDGYIQMTKCNCKAYTKYSGDCKHIVALLLFIKNLQKQKEKTEGSIKNILQFYEEVAEEDKKEVNLEVNYEWREYGSNINFRIGEERLYVVKKLSEFISQVSYDEVIEFGQKFTFDPQVHCFNAKDLELIDFLTILYENYDMNSGSNYGSRYERTFNGKNMALSAKSLEKFFNLMIDRNFNIDINGYRLNNATVIEEKIDLKFKIEEEGKDLLVSLIDEETFIPLSDDCRYIFYKDNVYKIPINQSRFIRPIINEIKDKDIKTIRVEEDLKEVFVSEVLLNIKKHTKLEIDEKVKDSIYSENLESLIYFDRKGEVINGKVEFNYGGIKINPFSSKKKQEINEGQILLRDMEKERKILGLLEQGDFKVEDGGFYLEDEEKIFDFINNVIPKLQHYSEVYYTDSFRDIQLIGGDSFSGVFKIDSGLDMLEFDFNIEGIDMLELGNVFHALREKKKYYKLKNGAFLSLENKDLNNVFEMMDYLDVDVKEFNNGKLELPKYRTMYLDKFLEDRDIGFIKKNANFKKLVMDIKEPDDIEYRLPKKLNAELRDYQKNGFKWIKSLSNYGFGGILADEMGLGKTVQMICFLMSEKEEKGQGVSLIVVPTSLVYNWEDEVNKFAPDLSTIIIAGMKSDRINLIKTCSRYDIVITSYPLIRKDIDDYKDIDFRYLILDEAQHIKNKGSLSAKSVKKIKAKNYFALTGTPMENSLSELWSIFDFLMPGYLLNSKKFTEKFEKPIVKENDSKKLRELNNYIKPFILRRLKKEVLKELPDKIEQKILVDMTDEQKKMYLAYLQAIKGDLGEEINEKGYNKSHIKILAGLTRLRQLSCDPSVFLEEYNGGSGKLDFLEEIVSEAVSGGHRILIFSQFTTMLSEIRKRLEKINIDMMYLDGKTSMEDRGKLVKQFNKGQSDVFLISLKAGGTGLNLTSADMVIHFDPWWNPAVEDQATDRAHRIGQENKVQVIKLITKGTIEEKIFKLQEKKKEMIDKVIREGETLISKLSEEEIMSLFDV